jgi:hypothetical protein
MTNTANIKGDILQAAVEAIESTILRTSPTLKENTLKIESKKTVVVGGVRHEIDIYVEVDLGNGYKSVFVFECKNWRDAVGKNEIIIFSEKIKALAAQRGFFIAKSFSKDAKAQAEQDSRLELLVVTEHDPSTLPVPFDFHFVHRNRSNASIEIHFRERGFDPRKLPLESTRDISAGILIHRGTRQPIIEFINELTERIAEENMNHFPSGTLTQGEYERIEAREIAYQPGELVVEEMEVESLSIKYAFKVEVIRPSVTSSFEVQKRGRSHSFASTEIGGVTTDVRITTVEQK